MFPLWDVPCCQVFHFPTYSFNFKSHCWVKRLCCSNAVSASGQMTHSHSIGPQPYFHKMWFPFLLSFYLPTFLPSFLIKESQTQSKARFFALCIFCCYCSLRIHSCVSGRNRQPHTSSDSNQNVLDELPRTF